MFTHHGGMGKRMLAGQAARNGSFAALLAANGYTNAPNVFEAEFGGFPAAHTGNQMPPAYDLTELTKGFGREWHATDISFKMWACRGPNNATLEGIADLRRQHPLPPEEIAKVEIRLGRGAYQNVGWAYTPSTITSAQLNLYYVAAVMLLENDVFVEQFTGETIGSPRVLDMISRIEIVHDASLDRGGEGGTPVKITLRDGAVFETVGRRRGSRGANAIQREDVVNKFHKMTAGFWDEATQSRALALCEGLDELINTEEMTALLAAEVPPLAMAGE
jgi:aconitate decarboxylase